ncbi:retrovirus-related pol polyprotein from transposon TNT 1-94 [Tanacetum coccineum]
MTSLADKSLLSGGDNKPPMLEKHLYDSWKSRMELYMMNRPHGRMILASVEKGPLVWPSITEDGVTRLKEYVELTPAEAIQADCDIKAINIILQGLPTEIYALVSQHRVAKDLWEKIKLLMQGTSLTKQERECKLYDEFDKFTYKRGETLHEYYLRFTLLLNDMNIYKMPLEQFQVNTKFLNTLPDEWSKFVTDVKLVKDLHTTNVDQLHAHLQQHERHAIEVRLMHERNPDPLALVASHQLTQPAYQSHLHHHPQSLSQHHVSPYQHSQLVTPYQHQQFSTNQSTPLSISYPTNEYQSTVHHNVYSQQPSIPQLEYAPTTYQQQQPEFSQPDSSLVVPVFQKGDDPIDAINHMMSFLTAVVTSRYPTTNNQLRTSSNPRQQATIYDGKVTVQPVQGRHTSYAAGTTRKYTPGASGSNTGKQRTVICYNCKGEGHIAKQCTKPKRKRDDTWFNDKVLLVQAQASGQTYDNLCKCFTTLEKHCITLEADSQLNHEIFQQENSVLNQNAPSFTQLFKLSELKAQSQAKDIVIVKLKEQIKSLKGNVEDSSVKMDMDEIETLNIELEHRVDYNLLPETEPFDKTTYKQLYDRIKPKRVQSKNNLEISGFNAKKIQEQGVRLSTSASGGSQPQEKIQEWIRFLQTPSSNSKNKVEAHLRNVKSSLNKRNGTVKVTGSASVQKSKKQDDSDSVCVNSNDCMPSDNLCVSNTVNVVKSRATLKRINPRKIFGNTSQERTISGDSILKCFSSTHVLHRQSRGCGFIAGDLEGDNLYTLILLGNMMASSLFVYCQKASKTKPGLVRGYQSRQNLSVAYGLCGPMVSLSVSGKKYILVIVDDYSRFTWVKCLRSKDEAPAFIINFLKMIQVRLKETVRRIRTDNGTEFVNQTLREYYEKVGISHETSVARSPQQNGVVERRNRTLIEAARTMLIYAKAPLFLWAKAVAT